MANSFGWFSFFLVYWFGFPFHCKYFCLMCCVINRDNGELSPQRKNGTSCSFFAVQLRKVILSDDIEKLKLVRLLAVVYIGYYVICLYPLNVVLNCGIAMIDIIINLFDIVYVLP